jgi:hypothetical protein
MTQKYQDRAGQELEACNQGHPEQCLQENSDESSLRKALAEVQKADTRRTQARKQASREWGPE